MFKVPVASSNAHCDPSMLFQQTNHLADLHRHESIVRHYFRRDDSAFSWALDTPLISCNG